MPAADYTPAPYVLKLPSGETIELDRPPHTEGWGLRPGKRYTVGEVDDDGNFLWTRSWIIPLDPIGA